MAKDRSKDSTQPKRHAPSRRGGSNIKDEEKYFRDAKAKLGDKQALRDHATLHWPGTPNPCTQKGLCREYARWVVLDLLEFYETSARVAASLRELGLVVISYEKVESLGFPPRASNPRYQILSAQPLHRFRELATIVLGVAGYSCQDVADLVDGGDVDRTWQSAAWRCVLDEYKRQGKRPPKKRRLHPDQGGQPDTATSMERPGTPLSPHLPGQTERR